MLFLCVGTQFPFDRLVRTIDEAVSEGFVYDKVYAQLGESSYVPKHFEHIKFLDKNAFDRYIDDASAVISHAGMGVISAALDRRKPLLVMPRQKKYGEVVNDHQTAIARQYERLGYLLVAYDVTELPQKIVQLRTFVPNLRQSQAGLVAERIKKFLTDIGPA
jgi:UDP-N-acetylglucosamine transferase subunit ALG13